VSKRSFFEKSLKNHFKLLNISVSQLYSQLENLYDPEGVYIVMMTLFQ